MGSAKIFDLFVLRRQSVAIYKSVYIIQQLDDYRIDTKMEAAIRRWRARVLRRAKRTGRDWARGVALVATVRALGPDTGCGGRPMWQWMKRWGVVWWISAGGHVWFGTGWVDLVTGF